MDVLLMKFDPDIPGTSTLDQYAKQIEVLSFSHGVAMQITGDISNSERTSGKPNHQDFTIASLSWIAVNNKPNTKYNRPNRSEKRGFR